MYKNQIIAQRKSVGKSKISKPAANIGYFFKL